MASPVWFGNAEHQDWVLAPVSGLDWSLVKRTQIVQLEHGGIYTDDSKASHREGVPEWEGTPAELRKIRDFYNGVHGPGPFYWHDPMISDQNVLAPNWATPGIISQGDWLEIHPTASAPAFVPTGPLEVPRRAATYAPTNLATAATPEVSFRFLVPPNHQVAFGCYGSRTGTAVVTLRGTTASGLTVTQSFAPLDPSSNIAWNATNLFAPATATRVVDVYLARTTAAASTITLAGLRAIVIPVGTPLPVTAPFASGEGVGGLTFSGGLREAYLYGPRNAAFRRRSMTTKLVEQWDLASPVTIPQLAAEAPSDLDGGTP